MDTQNAVSNRAVFWFTISGISSSSRRSPGHRQADEPAAVRRHEVDRVGRHRRRRERQIPFVLAVLVVDDDEHPAGAEGLDGLLDRGERPAQTTPGALRDAERGSAGLHDSLRQADASRGPDARQFGHADDVLADDVHLEVDAVADARSLEVACVPR